MTPKVVIRSTRRHNLKMKKLMSLMLGMSLVVGAASFAFAQDTSSTTKTTKKKNSKKTKKTTSTTSTSK